MYIHFCEFFYVIALLLPLFRIRIVILDAVFDINSNSIQNCAQAWSDLINIF